VIAFPAGCAYRRRLARWLGPAHAAARILELASYHAIVACVASGTGVALVPRSVLHTLECSRSVRVHRLPGALARIVTQFRAAPRRACAGGRRAAGGPPAAGAPRRARERIRRVTAPGATRTGTPRRQRAACRGLLILSSTISKPFRSVAASRRRVRQTRNRFVADGYRSAKKSTNGIESG
jgi:hypothetical protein